MQPKQESTSNESKITKYKQQISNKFQIAISKSQKERKPTVDFHFDFSIIDDWGVLSSRR